MNALAANQGHARAQFNLGNAYSNGKGVAQSYEKAFTLYTLAADQGHAKAQFGLGILYYHHCNQTRSSNRLQELGGGRRSWLGSH